MKETVEEIQKLKREKNAVIMAHYYVRDEVQAIADYIGDSYYLSEMATKIDADMIVLCGVAFMGESAKILNTGKKVLLPAADADCPMAHMASAAKIREIREQYEDVAVVCYVNSTAELKAASDVCVTSANALKIVKALPNQNIFFIPDQNLAHFIADQVPEKHFIFNDGYCPVHHEVTAEQIAQAKGERPEAQVLMHPECRPEVAALADYLGSTSGIIKYAQNSEADEFIIATEMGVLYELKRRCPEKKFHMACPMVCEGMKKVTLDGILAALEQEEPAVCMDASLMEEAHRPMLRMLELAAQQ